MIARTIATNKINHLKIDENNIIILFSFKPNVEIKTSVINAKIEIALIIQKIFSLLIKYDKASARNNGVVDANIGPWIYWFQPWKNDLCFLNTFFTKE